MFSLICYKYNRLDCHIIIKITFISSEANTTQNLINIALLQKLQPQALYSKLNLLLLLYTLLLFEI